MKHHVMLVRHTEVARAWRARCYGRSDVGLSRQGIAALGPLAAQLAAAQPAWVVHSDLVRTKRLARLVARLADCPLIADEGWRERDFGAWEGRSWNAIYRETGNAMDGMIDAPHDFRPGGGETTWDMALRVAQAWARLPDRFGVVLSHGGPIASCVGLLQRLSVKDWATHIPALGNHIILPRTQLNPCTAHPGLMADSGRAKRDNA